MNFHKRCLRDGSRVPSNSLPRTLLTGKAVVSNEATGHSKNYDIGPDRVGSFKLLYLGPCENSNLWSNSIWLGVGLN